jgi:hypothetical protein
MVLSIIAVVAIVLIVFSTVRPARSTDGTNAAEIILRVRPSIIMNYSLVSNQQFGVNITALKVVNLHGFNMKLSYDATLINCSGVQQGDLLQRFGATTILYTIDDNLGNIYASLNLTSPGAAANDNGTLLKLAFSVMNTGETKLHLYEVNLYDSEGSSLSYVTQDGYFNNKFNIDVTMPLTLLSVTLVSLFLNQKTESKLKRVFEEREFRVRDAVLLVAVMAFMISLIVLVRQITMILLGLFLFSYSLLLFMFGYLLSKNRWYIGVIPPITFILLYVLLRDTFVWTYYLSNVYGLVFAILITLYLSSMFTWAATAVFGILITVMDIILVLVTGTMVEAANAARGLSLPVLVSLPLVPLIATGQGLLLLSLGLGDFFFAGLLAIQTFKKYGRTPALVSVVTMTISFIAFEAYILTYNVGAFPGTLMVICGWIPVILWKALRR